MKMRLKTLAEAVQRGFLRIGDQVELDSSILSQKNKIILRKETGTESNQTINRKNTKFYYLGKENDVLKFVATKATEDKLRLEGEVGFENGLHILNKVCSDFFSNKQLGIYSYALSTKEFWTYFMDEKTEECFSRITTRGEAILATPYIRKEEASTNASPQMVYGFKTILGHIELINGNSSYFGCAGIIPGLKIYIPENIYYLEKEGKTPRLISEK